MNVLAHDVFLADVLIRKAFDFMEEFYG